MVTDAGNGAADEQTQTRTERVCMHDEACREASANGLIFCPFSALFVHHDDLPENLDSAQNITKGRESGNEGTVLVSGGSAA